MSFDENNSVPPEADPSILSYEAPQPAEASYGTASPPEFLSPQTPLVPEDLRVPWGWTDLLILLLVWIGATVVVTLFLGVVFQSRGISWSQLRQPGVEQGIFMVVDQVAISFLILAYLALEVRLGFNVPFWRTLGWRPLETGKTPRGVAYLGLVCGGFALSILVQLGSVTVGTKAKLPIETFFQDRRTALLLMLMSVLLAPLFEETIFRGYIYPVVARSFGVTAGIIATGTLFGLLHAEQLWGGWGQIGLLVIVGIIFTWARAVTKTVVASYLLHLSYNSFLFFAFLVTSDGLRSLPKT
ncbi:MAG TPA: type II CAAX endopeptidase family protein [Candidatus Acidoferrales bacterium]|nr:type II CAAX endopeptidase family protein [Candidatus Acidoferrales bacterium]